MNAFFVPHAPYRLLHVTGRDRVALLHNMTTADVRALASGAACEASLVDQKGVLLDWVMIHAQADVHTLVLHASRADAVTAWLERYIITEDVSLTGPNAEDSVWAVVSKDGVADTATQANNPATVWQIPGFRERARLFSGGPEQATSWKQSLETAGWVKQDLADLECVRVAWGIPAPHHDFDARTNPWEARLADAVSDNKGCYLGQEVVARLKNYDKVQRALIGLEVKDSGVPHPGDELFATDDPEKQRPLGRVTSVCRDAGAPGGFWVLAVVKRAWARPDQPLALKDPQGITLSVSTADRWFWQADQNPENK